jgi:hypothetical protein
MVATAKTTSEVLQLGRTDEAAALRSRFGIERGDRVK